MKIKNNTSQVLSEAEKRGPVEQPRQMIVLGMHRSGTSALTNALARMGVFVGDQDELTASNWENPHGFFERRDARRICDALLHRGEADWWKISRFDAGQLTNPVLGPAREDFISLTEKLDAKGHWAIKEPRLCVLLPIVLPLLRRVLPIVALRHPIEIAHSLYHRNGFSIQASLALWETYILRALRDSDGLDRCFVHYDALIRDPAATLERLATRLQSLGVSGLDPEQGVAAIDPALFREKQDGGQDWRLSPEQAHLWAMLKDLGVDGAGLEIPAVSLHATQILREFEIDQTARRSLISEKEASERERSKAEANLQRHQAAADEARAKLGATDAQLKTTRAELEAAKARSAETEAKHGKVSRELDETRTNLAGLNDRFDSARRELEVTTKRLLEIGDHHNKTLSKLGEDRERLVGEREALKGELTAQRRLSEKQARAHQDILRRAMERSADEIRAFGRARHKAATQIAKFEWNLNLAVRDKVLLEAERAAQAALLDAILGSTLWRVLSRIRKLTHNPIAARRRRDRVARSVSMAEVMALFDPDWYRMRNPDVALTGLDPLDHYLLRGAVRGRDPGPLFHVDFYLASAKTIGEDEEAARNPLIHYLTSGATAGLSPHALFDPAFYATENPDVVESGMNPLVHFILHGGQEGRSPSPCFDARWYLDMYPDVAAAGCNPLLHYLDHGTDEGRDPAPDFSTSGYLKSYPDVVRSAQNPLMHYQLFGRYEGRNPRGIGDPTATDGSTQQQKSPQPVPANLSTMRPVAPLSASPKPSRQNKLPLSALLISWDIGHNPVGRAYMLAEAVDRVVEHTVIAGFQFPRYGSRVWEPLRDSRLPVIPIPGHNLPDMIELARSIADQVRPDVVIACKPRLPALQLGMQIRDAAGCPLILDIDDHELSFFANRDPITMEQFEAVQPGEWANHVEPYGEEWTRLCEGLTGTADRILVSNTALQKRFGGVVVPHVRDESAFQPVDASARVAVRNRFGVPIDARVVLFFGTPRLHKGIGELAAAVAAIDDPRVRLVIIGDAPDKSVTAKLNQIAPGRVIQIPGQPFSAIPTIMALGDVVALPQDVDHPISQFQLPAKAIDAIAAGLPLLVTPTPPLMDLVSAGLAVPFEPKGLKDAIVAALNKPVTPESQAAVRERFLRGYSYLSAGESLRKIIGEAVAQKPSEAAVGSGTRLVAAQYRALGCEPPQPSKTLPEQGRDIVMFWKQNDSALYGRRNDMVARYLASRDDVRRVIVFDAPISRNKLIELRDRGRSGDQDRLIYTRTIEKQMGLRDEGKIARRVLVYQPRHVRNVKSNALQDQVVNHVRATLEQEGVDPSQAVFWLYPRNPFLETLVDTFKPARVVTDIVDDHRAWPNVSEDQRRELDQHYTRVLGFADFAMANCEPVRASMAKIRPDIRLIPNGCDMPSTDTTPSSSAFQRVTEWPGKVIGFTGNLEAKIDDELIKRLSRELPDALIVLVGSTHANPSVRELAELPNVLMPGVAPYEELGAWVSRFDVAIIPHRRMALTESMNPLKQYVYLSHGVPVVATNISGLEDVPGITVASDQESFVIAVRAALEAPRAAVATQDFIREHSWDARLSGFVDEILTDENSSPKPVRHGFDEQANPSD